LGAKYHFSKKSRPASGRDLELVAVQIHYNLVSNNHAQFMFNNPPGEGTHWLVVHKGGRNSVDVVIDVYFMAVELTSVAGEKSNYYLGYGDYNKQQRVSTESFHIFLFSVKVHFLLR